MPPEGSLAAIRRFDGPTARGEAGLDSPMPLLVLLHGFGADERDLVSLTPYLPADWDWVSLRGPLRATPAGGAAWFPLGAVSDLHNPDTTAIRDSTNAVLNWLDAHLASDAAGNYRRAVVPLGFSQGGLMVTELLRARPHSFAGGVVLSGLRAPVDHPGDSQLAALRPPVFFGHGDADSVVGRTLSDSLGAWLAEHSTLTRRIYPGLDHGIDASELADVSAFVHDLPHN